MGARHLNSTSTIDFSTLGNWGSSLGDNTTDLGGSYVILGTKHTNTADRRELLSQSESGGNPAMFTHYEPASSTNGIHEFDDGPGGAATLTTTNNFSVADIKTKLYGGGTIHDSGNNFFARNFYAADTATTATITTGSTSQNLTSFANFTNSVVSGYDGTNSAMDIDIRMIAFYEEPLTQGQLDTILLCNSLHKPLFTNKLIAQKGYYYNSAGSKNTLWGNFATSDTSINMTASGNDVSHTRRVL